MMPQMHSDEQANYGHYEGNTAYEQPQQASPYDDNQVEAIAQRLSQHMTQQGPQGKLHAQPPTSMSAGQRLALAIVSVVMLVPLGGIFMGAVKGIEGLIGFGIACLAVFLINSVFYGTHPWTH